MASAQSGPGVIPYFCCTYSWLACFVCPFGVLGMILGCHTPGGQNHTACIPTASAAACTKPRLRPKVREPAPGAPTKPSSIRQRYSASSGSPSSSSWNARYEVQNEDPSNSNTLCSLPSTNTQPPAFAAGSIDTTTLLNIDFTKFLFMQQKQEVLHVQGILHCVCVHPHLVVTPGADQIAVSNLAPVF